MLRKLIRWFLILTGVAIVLLAGALFALDRYLQSHEEKLVRDYAYPAGLDIVFREVDFSAWKDFPRVSLTIDSVVVRDTSALHRDSALLRLDRLHAEFSLATFFSDTVSLRRLDLTGGALRLVADSSGTFNAGNLLLRDSTITVQETGETRLPSLAWEGVHLGLYDLGFTFRLPPRNKWIDTRIDTLHAVAATDAAGEITVTSRLAVDVNQLAFNTEKGGFLTGARVSGPLDVRIGGEEIAIAPTNLAINGEPYALSADIDRGGDAPSFIYVANDRASYDRARPLLHDDLQRKLEPFYVTGEFPARATVKLPPGEIEEVTVDFTLDGQDVTAKGYQFTDVHTRASVVNRLDPAEGGIPGSKKNLRVQLDDLQAGYLSARIESPSAVIAVFGEDAVLHAPLRLSGPARTISDYLENRDFFFAEGRFVLETRIDASLLSFEDVATTSDGRLYIEDLAVNYQPAGARFPFRRIEVTKAGQDVNFGVETTPLATGFSFRLDGRVDNLTPLLVDIPGAQISSEVELTAPRVNWTDFLTFFGQGGYFPQDKEKPEPDAVAADPAAQAAALKTTLLGIRNTFRPSVEARIDTVGYYDVFTLTDVGTGLHFSGDSLVLDRTSFDWAGSEVGFGAQLDLAETGNTPFHLDVAARHLDLNALRSSLEYFGVYIPEGIDRLPRDLTIAFDHRGVIADSLGIEPGQNYGTFTFNDGRENLFAGSMDYAPGPRGLSTRLHLTGDPHIVNVLFGAENFFFGTGHFSIDMALEGTPADLRDLIDHSELSLNIDSSRVTHKASGVFVPVRSFRVDVREGQADYRMELMAGATRRGVRFDGRLDNISAFLYPRPDEHFSVTADAYAPSLRWSDFSALVQQESVDTTKESSFDLQSLFSATGGVFRAFRPDISLAVDTFYAGDTKPLINFYSGVRLQDTTRLLLEESGFRLDDGVVGFDASYALDNQTRSPFTVHFQADTLPLQEVRKELAFLGLKLPENIGTVRGSLTLDGELQGKLDETSGQMVMDSTHGTLDFRLSDAELVDWPMLRAAGRKARMEERLAHVRFAPLRGTVVIDSGRISIPRTEVQSTGVQVFLEGTVDPVRGPDLLISVPLRNIGRGMLDEPPAPTGYALSGWKVYLVLEPGDDGETKMRFRLGRRRFFRERGRLEEYRADRQRYREERKNARVARKKR